MARDLIMDTRPNMGPLRQPCLVCSCRWGYKTEAQDIESKLLRPDRKRELIVVCGLCGREQ